MGTLSLGNWPVARRRAQAQELEQAQAQARRHADELAELRSSFDAMFVNLSRRSQSLTERLARMLETMQQAEEDPARQAGLFALDHLVTRMRRNSENLLLLAGQDNPRQWSDPVSLADVARAATAEVEQYDRVALGLPGEGSVIGSAASDVVRLLAELIENATLFSPKDTHVHVTQQELDTGGVLIEVADQGIGVTQARLAEMNWRLDNPPPPDVSASRHMGLFAVARLAQRHRVRVRFRPGPAHGVSALVWLPDSVLGAQDHLGRVGGEAEGANIAGLAGPAGWADSQPPGWDDSAGPAVSGEEHPAGDGGSLPRRSPEQARDRLSGFQRGARRAENEGGHRVQEGDSES